MNLSIEDQVCFFSDYVDDVTISVHTSNKMGLVFDEVTLGMMKH